MKIAMTPRTLEFLIKQGNGVLDIVAPEVFYQIMMFLQPKDLRVCMCVSKKWKLLLSTSYFWRNYVDHNFDFNDDDDEELTGMLHELGSTWIFGNGTGMLPSIPQGDLFEEFPRRWKSGIIHPVGPDVHVNVEDHKSFCEALYQLQKLKNEIDEREIVYTGQRADRGECPIDVILFAWGKDQLPSVKEIIEILHLNTNLHLHVIYETSERRFGEGDELGKLFKCRRQLPGESSFFETLPKVIDGFVKVRVDYQGRMNSFRPSPVFILTQLSPGWCGGVLTGVW
ncbi:hypothetical protein ABFA07_009158 [Porites harrisoni]